MRRKCATPFLEWGKYYKQDLITLWSILLNSDIFLRASGLSFQSFAEWMYDNSDKTIIVIDD